MRLASLTLTVLLAFSVPSPFLGPSKAEKSGYEFSTDWTTTYSKLWLTHLESLVGRADIRGLEIGCFEGRSTIWFLENIAQHATASMTCIDVFTDSIEKRFDHNIKLSGHADRVTKLKGFSQDMLRGLDYESFDFVYIDGCHTASCVLTDSVLSWDLLKPGGFIIFDDYLWKPRPDADPTERPMLAIDSFVKVFANQLEVKAKGFQLIVEKTIQRNEETLVGKPIVHTDEWENKYELKRTKQKNNAKP
jgi:predicted O-methyltransferase YrrM